MSSSLVSGRRAWQSLFWLLFLCTPLSALGEQYGAWQFQDFGDHHLPPILGTGNRLEEMQIYGSSIASFDGLVSLSIDGQPHFFDVFSNDLVQVSDEGRVVGVDGPLVVANASSSISPKTLYDHRTRETTEFLAGASAEAFGINQSGQVVLSENREGITKTHFGVLVWPEMRRIAPPEVEVVPGLSEPMGELTPQDISATGWVAGLFADGTGDKSFLASPTGDLQIFPDVSFAAVNDHGQAIGSGREFWDGERFLDIEARRVRGSGAWHLNNAGQVTRTLALDDEGRILEFRDGPVVQVESPIEPGLLIDVPTKKLVIGLPLLIEGDYNANGLVDQGDLNLVLLNWGRPAEEVTEERQWVHDLPAGEIDQAELNAVLLGWGSSDGVLAAGMPGVPGSGSVPEPASVVLTLLLAAGLAPVLRARAADALTH